MLLVEMMIYFFGGGFLVTLRTLKALRTLEALKAVASYPFGFLSRKTAATAAPCVRGCVAVAVNVWCVLELRTIKRGLL